MESGLLNDGISNYTLGPIEQIRILGAFTSGVATRKEATHGEMVEGRQTGMFGGARGFSETS